MDYMPYIEEQFWRAMGLHLDGLRDFTAWIKPGSYYHGESHRDSQKKAETPATSSSEPNTGATATPVMETPVVETPVTRSDTPAPMETGRAGDSQSWAE